jgi:hypothetical protein
VTVQAPWKKGSPIKPLEKGNQVDENEPLEGPMKKPYHIGPMEKKVK